LEHLETTSKVLKLPRNNGWLLLVAQGFVVLTASVPELLSTPVAMATTKIAVWMQVMLCPAQTIAAGEKRCKESF